MPEGEESLMPNPERPIAGPPAGEAGILPEKYPDLHSSKEVNLTVGVARSRGERIPNAPKETVSKYLGSLLGRHGLLGGNDEAKRRQITHHIIKPDQISEKYWDNQRRLIRERGQGADLEHVDWEDFKRQNTEAIIQDQTKSLENWVEYLNHPDANYPGWFRYFAMRSVLVTGPYDKEKHQFTKRSNNTTSPYIDLNREALAYVYDSLNKTLDKKELEQIPDNELQQLLKAKNFGKLYSHAIEKVTPANVEQRQQIAGEWIKYNQTNDQEEALRLARSLQGHGTGWCTAGEETAKIQLSGGDFYVYYSYDQDNNPTIPRIAIRMENGAVAEVRGINKEQNLEPIMGEIAEERLATLPGGGEYQKKAEDMKRLTQIENRINSNAELDSEELRFLYELDRPIEGFGYQKDPRISEIQATRDKDKDMLIVFYATENQIARSVDQINVDTKAYVGQLTPGIFEKIRQYNTEYVCISFPEERIRFDTLRIGGKSVAELENELERENINVSRSAKQMMHKPEFTISPTPEDIDLVILRVKDLGLFANPTADQVCRRAQQLGLQICPPEVAPKLCLSYRDQPLGEVFVIEKIQRTIDFVGYSYVFDLGRDNNGVWLNSNRVGPGYYDPWHPDDKVVFSLSKSSGR